MSGVITTWHLISQARLIIKLYGWSIYFKCWKRTLQHKKCTFLECMW